MNFLAHAVLAGADHRIVAGSLTGDFVKGVVRDGDFPPAYTLGIRLHRRIDAFSNAEPHLRASADRMPAALRRIAPPCIDVLADHLLARAIVSAPDDYLPPRMWDASIAVDPLVSYEARLHELLGAHAEFASPTAQRFFSHARTSDLFSEYRRFERTSRGIAYVCERLRRPADAPAMVAALAANMQALEQDFVGYWPALRQEAERFLAASDGIISAQH